MDRKEREDFAYDAGCADAENGDERFTSLTGAESNSPYIRAAYLEGYTFTLGRLATGEESKRFD